MQKVRIGVVGVSGMGSFHANYLAAGKVSRCDLAAVCDINPKALERFGGVKHFTDSGCMIRSGEVDAVLIATPHYFHTTIGIDALKNGLHVLVEKPISVHKADCERLLAAHTDKKLVFAAMFNQRTDPRFVRVKRLVEGGELGELRRMNWVVTDWFRTEAYYASGGWRATWAGEGGGVLLNQSPHQLDLCQWICGMPSNIWGFCKFGARHQIEVEDEVTAYFEYPNGATGVFITSTGETPGTNRLELTGERGKITVEDGRVTFIRNEVPMTEFSRTTNLPFGKPDVWKAEIPVEGAGGQHQEITQNFVDAILDGAKLVAPAREGMRSVEMANAIVYSAMRQRPVAMPLSGKAYESLLKKLVRGSKTKKRVVEVKAQDVTASFRR